MRVLAGAILAGFSLLSLTVLSVQPGPMRLWHLLLLVLLLTGTIGGVLVMFLPDPDKPSPL